MARARCSSGLSGLTRGVRCVRARGASTSGFAAALDARRAPAPARREGGETLARELGGGVLAGGATERLDGAGGLVCPRPEDPGSGRGDPAAASTGALPDRASLGSPDVRAGRGEHDSSSPSATVTPGVLARATCIKVAGHEHASRKVRATRGLGAARRQRAERRLRSRLRLSKVCRVRGPLLPFAVVLLGVAAGCGHPATEAECTRIFERSAEFELAAQNVTDATLVTTRVAALRADRGEELIKKCVGRRITPEALGCVERATSPSGVDACFY